MASRPPTATQHLLRKNRSQLTEHTISSRYDEKEAHEAVFGTSRA